MSAGNDHMLHEKRPQPYFGGDISPLKNPFCPYYNECLEMAAEAGWPQFTCSDCGYRDLHLHRVPQAYEMEGHYRLLERIFSPGR